MPFCPECGKPVAPSAKFCRNCGASQLEVSLPAPAAVALPVTSASQNQSQDTLPRSPPIPQSRPAEPLQVVTQAPPAQVICSACGSPLSEGEKFCGICGASAGHPAPPEPAPASPIPPPPQPYVAAVLQPVPVPDTACRVCGNPLRPGDKFCGMCCALVAPAPGTAQAISTRPPPVDIPLPASVPAAVPVIPAPSRICRVCGTPVKSGAKFCNTCCAVVKPAESGPVVTVPSTSSPPAPAPVSPAIPVCASCGSPAASGTEKFCGICGAPAGAAPPSVPAQPAGKTCGSCGALISETTKFCGGCGAPVGASFRPSPVTLHFQDQ